MANDEVIGPRKTMFVLVIVVGCFAVLWPRILSPLVLGPTRDQIQPNQFDRDAGCCEVIFETDVALLELVNEVCHSAWGVGKLSPQSAAECRKAVNDTCGVDIAVFLKRNENVGKTTKMLVETMQSTNSSCLREHFGVPIYSLGPHLAANSWSVKDTLKQERASPMRGMGPHPALRERGRAIPPGPPGPPPPSRPVTLPPHIRVRSPLSVYYGDQQPPPIPGMRPPLGSPGGPVPAPKSSMGFVMPIYTICIIVFFVYTLTKIMFRRQGSPYDPVAPDPQFRRRVFRDDSRSSPEKLGKKEADTIVTAISGLVAEVQQQMEASAAPNQQRQDVQDNARPYTNGTILLNSGPVQIVTSEYKEASKEKTPEPVTEKESTPEPKEAVVSKVVTESSFTEDESILKSKESLPEIEQPSPESDIVQQEYQATPETVVVRKSSPEASATEYSEKSFRGVEQDNKSISEPISYPTLAPSVTEVAKESIVELDSELVKSIPQLRESTPEVLQGSDPKSNINDAEPIKVSELFEGFSSLSDSKDTSKLESDREVTDTSTDLLPELVKPTTDHKTLSSESESNEPIPEPKETSPEHKSTPESNITSLDSNKLIETENRLENAVPDLKKSSSSAKESSPKIEEILTESSLEPKESSKVNEPLEPHVSNIASQVTSSEPEKSVLESKELSIKSDSNESVTEPKVSSQKLKEPTLEQKEASLDPSLLPPQPTELSLESVPILDTEVRPESEDSESNVSLNIREPSTIILEQQKIIEDIDQSISKHESSTPKEFTSDLIENSQEIKAPIVERSPESKFIENSPEIEAPIVESSPETKLTENTSEIEAPIVERSSETELTDHSSEIEKELLRLKEPISQSKETSPDRKLTEESKNTEENAPVPEEKLLDLEEAIVDVDNRTEKPEEKESKEAKTDLQEQNDQDSEELLNKFENTANDIKDDLIGTNDQFLKEERFVLVRRSTPDVSEERKSKPSDSYKLYTEPDEEDLENAAVKVMGMELTAHPADGGEWPRDERPPAPVSPPPRAPHAAEDVKSIFLETEIPQQSRVLVAQFEEDRPPPAPHAPLVVSGKMTLSLIQDAPRDTPDRDLESTLDEFTTASAVTQPAAEKGDIESDEEIDEEIEVEEIELEEEEEEEEEEEPLPVKTAKK